MKIGQLLRQIFLKGCVRIQKGRDKKMVFKIIIFIKGENII
jgi:hypothetical protein